MLLALKPPQISAGSASHGMLHWSLLPYLPYELPHTHTDTVSVLLRTVCRPAYLYFYIYTTYSYFL